jgi:hypothetical protein
METLHLFQLRRIALLDTKISLDSYFLSGINYFITSFLLVSIEKSAVILMDYTWFFSLAIFNILSLLYIVNVLAIM